VRANSKHDRRPAANLSRRSARVNLYLGGSFPANGEIQEGLRHAKNDHSCCDMAVTAFAVIHSANAAAYTFTQIDVPGASVADAVIGLPFTPLSYAGVARRTARVAPPGMAQPQLGGTALYPSYGAPPPYYPYSYPPPY
jgi:hypothetical protein